MSVPHLTQNIPTERIAAFCYRWNMELTILFPFPWIANNATQPISKQKKYHHYITIKVTALFIYILFISSTNFDSIDWTMFACFILLMNDVLNACVRVVAVAYVNTCTLFNICWVWSNVFFLNSNTIPCYLID